MIQAELKQEIQELYSEYLKAQGFTARGSQKVMIGTIAKHLCRLDTQPVHNSRVAVIEAGTGVGKTLAYLISALPTAKFKNKKLIVSTATVALQSQLLDKDLPDLQKHTDLDFEYALAKGRGRYLCVKKLETIVSGGVNLPLFMEEPAEETLHLYSEMMDQFAQAKWAGDLDDWPGEILPEQRGAVTTDTRQCSNRRCEYFNSCPYFEARRSWEGADLVVANHDLVLSDLSLGGGAILSAPEDTIYIFDEGHHIADKAVSHFTVRLPVRGMQIQHQALSQSLVQFTTLLGEHSLYQESIRQISESALLVHDCSDNLYLALNDEVFWVGAETSEYTSSVRHRFQLGQIPEDIINLIQQLRVPIERLVRHLGGMVDELERAMDQTGDEGLSKEEAAEWYPILAMHLTRIEAYLEAIQFYLIQAQQPPVARWLSRSLVGDADLYETDIVLYGSPLHANERLQDVLWDKAHGVIVTSATLRSMQRFTRIADKSGFPEGTLFMNLPSPFNYPELAQLNIPNDIVEPSRRDEHTQYIIDQFDAMTKQHKAVLVLFSSRQQMWDVYQGLDSSQKEQVLLQDDFSRSELLKQHRERVDSGCLSVLFGLDSLAEGIDLAGHYLTHVVIAKIPFAVPDDPIEESRSEWLSESGRNAFYEMTLPDASLKLIQSCGRLVRSETDSGEITILDKRLVSKAYGGDLLSSLPPYRRR